MKDSESNSRRQAVALAYQEGDAPRILARGYGDLAERIIAEARRQDVFVHDAPVLNFVHRGVNYNSLILIKIIFDLDAALQFRGLVTALFPAIETLVSDCLHICE